MIKKITGLLILCTVSFFSSASCNTGNVYTDISCYEKQDAIIKKQMKEVYSNLNKLLKGDGKTSLSESQKAWIVYRDKQCEVLNISAEMLQGAGYGLAHISCITDINKKRLIELKYTLEEIRDINSN